MLSLVGSLQPDPFSPSHVPKSAVPITVASTVLTVEEGPEPEQLPELSDDEDIEEEEDPFAILTRERDMAVERQQALSNAASPLDQQQSKEEKRRRKEEKRARKAAKKAEKAEKAVKFDVPGAPDAKEKSKKKRKKAEQES